MPVLFRTRCILHRPAARSNSSPPNGKNRPGSSPPAWCTGKKSTLARSSASTLVEQIHRPPRLRRQRANVVPQHKLPPVQCQKGRADLRIRRRLIHPVRPRPNQRPPHPPTQLITHSLQLPHQMLPPIRKQLRIPTQPSPRQPIPNRLRIPRRYLSVGLNVERIPPTTIPTNPSAPSPEAWPCTARLYRFHGTTYLPRPNASTPASQGRRHTIPHLRRR